MALDLEELSRKFDEAIKNITQEDIEKYFSGRNIPDGWVDIEEHLPMMRAIDISEGYTLFLVKDKDGNEFESPVSDHNTWYYAAKEQGITHWKNN